MRALIDGDILLYRACTVVEQGMYTAYLGDKPVASFPRKKFLEENYEFDRLEYARYIGEDAFTEAKWNFRSMLTKNIKATGCGTDYKIFLTGSNNYRKEICPEYKANRKEKPILYNQMLDYVLTLPKTYMIHGEEADDRLGIEQTDNTVICTIDKDLLMVEGKHYNFVKDEHREVTPDEGLKNFYTQLLTGDKTDNIIGIKGIGPVKASRLLEGCETELDMYNTCYEVYECAPQDILTNARLLWIRREEDEIWQPPSTTVTLNETATKDA